MSKEYEARAETTANNIQLLKNNMVHLGIAIGSVVLPALNGLINDIKPVIESVIGFAKANPVLVGTLFKVVAALFAFKVGSLAVRFGLNLLVGGFLSVYGSLLRVFGAFRLVNASIRLFQMAELSQPCGCLDYLLAKLALRLVCLQVGLTLSNQALPP